MEGGGYLQLRLFRLEWWLWWSSKESKVQYYQASRPHHSSTMTNEHVTYVTWPIGSTWFQSYLREAGKPPVPRLEILLLRGCLFWRGWSLRRFVPISWLPSWRTNSLAFVVSYNICMAQQPYKFFFNLLKWISGFFFRRVLAQTLFEEFWPGICRVKSVQFIGYSWAEFECDCFILV